MPNIWLEVNNDLKQAMRNREKERMAALRMLLAALKNKIIEIGHKRDQELPDDISIQVIRSEIKKRKDSIVSYEQAERRDLADREKQEIEVLAKYIPEMMGLEEITAVVKEVAAEMGEININDFGRVMGQAMKKLKGKADGELVGQAVKRILQN